MRVKTFINNDVSDLEFDINEWLEKQSGSDWYFKIVKIMQSSAEWGTIISIWYEGGKID